MRHRNAQNVLSTVLAFVMIFTCNAATFQPLAAHAATSEQAGEVEGASAAPIDATASTDAAPAAEGKPTRVDADGAADGEPGEREERAPAMQADAAEGEAIGETEPRAPGEGAPAAKTPGTPAAEEDEAGEKVAPEAPEDTSQDVTNDLDQLLLGVAAFSYRDAQGVSHDIPDTGTEDSPRYDFSSVPFATVRDMYMQVDFKIVRDDERRVIDQGDYYRYALPSIFVVDEHQAAQSIFSPSGQKIAEYTIDRDADGASYFKVVFTDTVDLDKGFVSIVGGVGATFTLDGDRLQADGPTEATWNLQAGGATYTFVAPGTTSKLEGVEKTGVYRPDDATATWTVAVGTAAASAGLSLKGVTVTDTFDADQQELVGVADADGAPLAVDESPDGFSYTFPADSTAVAPYRLVVTTKMAKGVLDATVTGDQEVRNDVAMTSPASAGVVVPPDQGATGSVSVPRFGFSKQGEALNSSVIAWKLTVNEGGAGAATNVVVYDALDERATLVPGTLTVDDSPVQVYEAIPDPAPSDTFAVLTKPWTGPDGAKGSLLEVHFAGMVSAERHIAFETDIALADTADKQQDISFPNEAWIDYDWPVGPGPGEGVIPTITVGTDFQVAHIRKETPSYDARTGVITWTIDPTTRSEDYERGVITDVVGATADAGTFDQELLPSADNPTGYAVEVAYHGAPLVGDELAGVFSYDEASHEMTFTFDQARYELNGLAITYRSQALDYLGENMVDHAYRNTADLVVTAADRTYTAQDSAERTFENEFLTKRSDYEVIDGAASSTGYLHYRITVNGSQMPNTWLSMTDDLSALATTVVDASGIERATIAAEKWTLVNGDATDASVPRVRVWKTQGGAAAVDATSTFESDIASWIVDRKVAFSVSGEQEASARYDIDLYLTLDKAELEKLYRDEGLTGGFHLLVKNAAHADADGYRGANGATVECVGSQDAPDVSERFVAKSVDGSHQAEGYLDYRVELNPNGLNLQGAAATDVPDASLDIDLASVQLNYAVHDGASIKDGVGVSVPEDAWSKQLVYDATAGSVVLRVGLPDGTASYVLSYRARIVGSPAGGKASNTVSVAMGGTPLGKDTVSADVDASSWGWLDQKAVYKLVKVDALSGETSPLAGVRFFLSEGATQGAVLKTAVSNRDGLVSFYGLEPKTEYCFWEDPDSVDAARYTTTSGTFTTGDRGTVVIQGQDNAVKNDRTVSDVPVHLTKQYRPLGATPYPGAAQSAFKLYLYPNGFGTSPKLDVPLSGGAGSYAYAAGGTVQELHDDAARGLEIAGLPWGDYGIEETATTAGYTRYTGVKLFRVNAPETAGATWSVDYEPTGKAQQDVGASQSIANEPTALTVKKTAPGGLSLKGVKLGIYLDENGVKGATFAKNAFTGDELTTGPLDAGAGVSGVFTWDVSGIPAGTYWLVEDEGADDAHLDKFDDVRFTVDAFGKVVLASASDASVSGTTIAVVDEDVKVTVKKLDQWGVPVDGAVLTLQKFEGGTWVNVEKKTTTAGEGGGLVFEGLVREATYRIVETAVPTGYVPANHEADAYVRFEINANGKAVNVDLHNGNAPAGSSAHGAWRNEKLSGNAFALRNERVLGHAAFKKLEAAAGADKPLAGVTFDLYRAADAGTDIADERVNDGGSFASAADGTVTTVGSTLTNRLTGQPMSRGLEPGTYYFRETGTGSHGDFAFDADDPLETPTFAIDESNRTTWTGDGTTFTSAVDAAALAGGAVRNEPLSARVMLQKRDGGSGGAIVGATFELRPVVDGAEQAAVDTRVTARAGATFEGIDSNGNVRTSTAARDGELWFPNVAAGTYHVVETAPAPGYRLSDAVYEVEVSQSSVGAVYAVEDAGVGFVANERTSFGLDKVDAETGAPVHGVELAVYAADAANAGSELFTWARAADGTVTFAQGASAPETLAWENGLVTGLPAGSYVLRETVVPEAYVAAADVPFALHEDGALTSGTAGAVDGQTLVMRDRPALAAVKLTKAVAGGAPGTVEGVEFGLFRGADAGGELVAEGLVVGADGTLVYEGLGVGTYYFVETKATPDTVLDPTPHAFAVTGADDGATVAVRVENRAFAASLELVKRDASTGDALAGAAFKLTYVPEGGGAERVFDVPAVGGETGRYVASGLEKGTYTIEETTVPNGYEQPFKARFVLGDGDDGAKLALRAGAATASGAVELLSGSWDRRGVANARIPGSLALEKVDAADGAPLDGAQFTLVRLDAAGDVPVGTFETGKAYASPADMRQVSAAAGVLSVGGLAWGAYRITETRAADGYAPGVNAPSYEFVIGPDDGMDVALAWNKDGVANDRTRIAIDKVDGDVPMTRLAGASLRLTGRFADASTEKVWTSAADGAMVLEGQLVVGETYELTETARLVGHLPLHDPVTFTVTAAGTLSLAANPTYADGSKAAVLAPDAKALSLRNVAVRGEAMLKKTDADTGSALNGVTFALYDDAGSLVRAGLATGTAYAAGAWTSAPADDGVLSVTGLDLGSYYFQETAALGYQVSSERFPFVVDERNATASPSVDVGTVANRPTELSFDKVELFAERCSDPVLGADAPEAARPLAGAQFTAYVDEGCTTAARTVSGTDAVATSGADGRVTFKGLPGGATYYVRETAVPEGHVDVDDVYAATFNGAGVLTGFLRADTGEAVAEVANDVPRADIRLLKVSELDASKTLSGSVYGLFKRSAGTLARGSEALQLVAKATTGADGMLAFEGVFVGQEYVVRELEAPDGSHVSKHPIIVRFEIGDDGRAVLSSFDDGSGTAEVGPDGTVVWKEPQVVVELAKTDVDGEPLAGATLQLVDANGAAVGEPWTTDVTAVRRLEGQLVGGAAYRLVELEAPDGYQVADDVAFTVETPQEGIGPNENRVQRVVMVDEPEVVPPPGSEDGTVPGGSPESPTPPTSPASFASRFVKTGDAPLALATAGIALAAAGIAAAARLRRSRARR